MVASIRGLQSLKKTYETDTTTVARIETLIEQIEYEIKDEIKDEIKYQEDDLKGEV